MVAQPQPVNIGDITELYGNARVVRDNSFIAELNFDIQQNDNVETASGRIGITFIDNSQVRLTEHSQLIIDEYIFNPNPQESKLSLNFARGTARFISSEFNLIDKENVTINTPTAQIAIRGTDFTATVDELGRSLVILLPNANGIASGEIEVFTATGSVTLNQPYQATTVSVFESSPTQPVILDLTLELIDNMLIVQPPRAIQQEIIDEFAQNLNILDINYLEFNDLDTNYLENNNLEFTELDIDYLNVNFFEDLLQIIEELDRLEKDNLQQSEQSVRIVGTTIGQDTETQIITLIQGNIISMRRNIESNVQLDLDSGQSYTVIFIQNGVSNTVKINGGSDSTIVIKQGR